MLVAFVPIQSRTHSLFEQFEEPSSSAHELLLELIDLSRERRNLFLRDDASGYQTFQRLRRSRGPRNGFANWGGRVWAGVEKVARFPFSIGEDLRSCSLAAEENHPKFDRGRFVVLGDIGLQRKVDIHRSYLQ